LQPDLAGERLAYDEADPGDLDVEGIERVQMRFFGRPAQQAAR
jgi:hypothetical protein